MVAILNAFKLDAEGKRTYKNNKYVRKNRQFVYQSFKEWDDYNIHIGFVYRLLSPTLPEQKVRNIE